MERWYFEMKFIKHEDSMDVCYEIFASDDIDYFCYAWNMGQISCFQINHDSIRIPMTKVIVDKGWQVCDNYKDIIDNEKSFRDGKWSYLK